MPSHGNSGHLMNLDTPAQQIQRIIAEHSQAWLSPSTPGQAPAREAARGKLALFHGWGKSRPQEALSYVDEIGKTNLGSPPEFMTLAIGLTLLGVAKGRSVEIFTPRIEHRMELDSNGASFKRFVGDLKWDRAATQELGDEIGGFHSGAMRMFDMFYNRAHRDWSSAPMSARTMAEARQAARMFQAEFASRPLTRAALYPVAQNETGASIMGAAIAPLAERAAIERSALDAARSKPAPRL